MRHLVRRSAPTEAGNLGLGLFHFLDKYLDAKFQCFFQSFSSYSCFPIKDAACICPRNVCLTNRPLLIASWTLLLRKHPPPKLENAHTGL